MLIHVGKYRPDLICPNKIIIEQGLGLTNPPTDKGHLKSKIFFKLIPTHFTDDCLKKPSLIEILNHP